MPTQYVNYYITGVMSPTYEMYKIIHNEGDSSNWMWTKLFWIQAWHIMSCHVKTWTKLFWIQACHVKM